MIQAPVSVLNLPSTRSTEASRKEKGRERETPFFCLSGAGVNSRSTIAKRKSALRISGRPVNRPTGSNSTLAESIAILDFRSSTASRPCTSSVPNAERRAETACAFHPSIFAVTGIVISQKTVGWKRSVPIEAKTTLATVSRNFQNFTG